jgi:aldehyde dehydrogenase
MAEMLSQAHEALDVQTFEDSAGRRVLSYDPVGLTTVITPWNWPVVLSVMKVTPALLAGNPVILKPAPNTPLVITEMMSVVASHLPAGVLSVVQGAAEVGGALVSDPRVRRVSFTGSIATGRRVYAAAASTVKNITLELGGNDPAVILEDADLSPAVIDSLLDAMFITTGQVCMAIKRIYVHESRFAELRDALAQAGDRFVVGDGLDPTATLGPLNNKMQFDRVTHLTAAAKDRGAELIPLGHRSHGLEFDKGYFMMPALATGIDESVELVAEEQFGPIVPILPFGDDDEAIRRANDTEYGLCSSVWSSDEDRAFEVARQLQSGIGWVNQHGLAGLDFMLSAGGVKQSGFGREGGVDGMRGFTNERYVTSR